MGKAIEFMAAIILIALLLVAQLYPTSPLFWATSATTAFTVLRYTLVVVLLWLLIQPPKTKWLRVPLGLSTLLLAVWLIDTTYQGTLGFIDFLTLSAATIALLTALLESKPREEEFKSIQLVTAALGLVLDEMRVASTWALQLGWLLMIDLKLSLDAFSATSAQDLGIVHRHRHQHV